MKNVMIRRRRAVLLFGPLGIGALFTAAVGWGSAADAPDSPQELPEGVTPAMIAQGDSIFHGPGFCYACHAPDATGVPQLGSDLTDDQWDYADGSYQSLVDQVTTGISAEASSNGVPMPPKGGALLSEEQIQAVAAYVWTLSRDGS